MYEVLNRKRGLTIKMVRELHKNLGLPTDSLLGIKRHVLAADGRADAGGTPRTWLCELRTLAGHSEWVLPSSRSGGIKPVSASALNQALATVERWPEGLLIHDLRRTVRTQLSEMGGVPMEVAELCLNHRPKGVHGVYDRAERFDERAVALQRWADRLDELLVAASSAGWSALRKAA